MEPLTRLPEDTRRRVHGVVFDVDDTVTRRGRLERSAFDAMWELSDKGLTLIAVTGRPLGWCDVLARHWPIQIAIGENGAGWIAATEGRLLEGYYDPPSVRGTQQRTLQRIKDRVRSEMPQVAAADDQRARRCDLAFDIGERQSLSSLEIEQLTRIIESEGARASVSTVHAHAIPGGWDKGHGIEQAAAEVLGVIIDNTWVFVGDSSNDAAAFERFPLTVGVRNIEDYLGRMEVAPGYITDADRGEGFAELARVLLSGP